MTLGSLWPLFARETQVLLVAGTVSVLAGVAIGLAPAIGFQPAGGGGEAPLELLLPSLFLSLGGGYAVLFPGIRVGRGKVHIVRDWKLYPVSGRLLWILAHATAVIGLVACVLAAATNPAVPGLLVWLFMGPYLALTGWAAALLGMAANVRLIGHVDGPLAPVTRAS
ncbi:hypothetical protein [Pseudarthrobacter sp. Y6]|uniref:hypothetical protein n=1 Tax=Pseudarthrobacter sp. Y6 TaxID=3418422 RepID=UPI003CEF2B9E